MSWPCLACSRPSACHGIFCKCKQTAKSWDVDFCFLNKQNFSGRWPLPLARFCVTFCPLFLSCSCCLPHLHWLATSSLPTCPLLVSRRIAPCLRFLNSMFHLQKIKGICFLPGGKREDIRHQASGVPQLLRSSWLQSPKWTDDGSSPLSILISIDFYFLPHLSDVIQDAVAQNARFNPITFPLAQVGQWRGYSKSNKAARWHVILSSASIHLLRTPPSAKDALFSTKQLIYFLQALYQ